MADGYLVLITNVKGSFEEGDIFTTVNHRKCRAMSLKDRVFAKDPVTRRHARIDKRSGFIPLNDPARDFFEATAEFRIERLGWWRMRKVRLSDGASVEFEHNKKTVDTLHHGNPETAKDLMAFYDKKITTWLENNSRGVHLFGTRQDNVVFYTGIQEESHANLDVGWKAVENKLGIAESSVDMTPTFSDLRRRLVIPVDDFDDDEGRRLKRPLLGDIDPRFPDDPAPELKPREFKVERRSISGIKQADVLDERKEIKPRDTAKQIRATAVEQKARPVIEGRKELSGGR